MISQKQNQRFYYKLLKSQRVSYSRAKSIRFTKYGVTLLLIIVAPIIFIYKQESISFIGILGALWALISFLIGFIESWLVKRAATIQEIYDTELYEIEWNKVLFGAKIIPHEYINGLTKKYSVSELELNFKDWYEGIDNIESPLAILICQRQNIVWDYKLREIYAFIILGVLIVNFLTGLALFAFTGETLLNYLLGLILPSLSAYILGIEELIGHWKIAKRKKNLENDIMSFVNEAKTDIRSLTISKLREIQNVIFNERLKAPLIPDIVYNRLKKRFSDSSILSISDIMKLNN